MSNKEIELVTYTSNQGNVPNFANNYRHQETNLSTRSHPLKSNHRSSSSCLFDDLNAKKELHCTSLPVLDYFSDKKFNWKPIDSEESDVRKWTQFRKSSLDSIVSKAIPGWFLLTKHRQVSAKSKVMTLNRSVSSFTSYVHLEAGDMGDQKLEPVYPRLENGELGVKTEEHVCLYSSQGSGFSSTMYASGTMYVSTFKISFEQYASSDVSNEKNQNKRFHETDIPLASIETVYEIHGENDEKKRKLPFGSVPSGKVNGIFIRCKNFKFYKFNFKFADIKSGQNIVIPVLHHARNRIETLPGYEHYIETVDYSDRVYWDKVIEESQCPGVRVSSINEHYQVSPTLPPKFVVPLHLIDRMVELAADNCSETRPPIWLWGNKNGGSLYVQPQYITENPDLDKDYFRSEIKPYDTTKSMLLDGVTIKLPKLSQLEDSFTAILDLFCLENDKEMEEKDKYYFSSLENSNWLSTILSVLRISANAAENYNKGHVVVVRDTDGRSYSILIASLVMILTSEEFRTYNGLEKIIRRNWINMGFPFNQHHNISVGPNKQPTSNLCPLFLIFLDCIHQLCFQFPACFEFQPSYLIHIWDSAFLPITQTFIFDNEHDREVANRARADSSLIFPESSAFDWSLQFTPEQIKSWDNPLYLVPVRPSRKQDNVLPEGSMALDRKVSSTILPETRVVLPVLCHIASLEVWLELFHRSVPAFAKADSLQCHQELINMRRDAREQIDANYANTQNGNGHLKKNNHKK